MSNDQNLESYFEAGDAPAVDARFRLAVMERVARRRFHLAIIAEFALFVAAALCFWMLSPTLGTYVIVLGQSQSNVLAILALVALGAFGGHWLVTRKGRFTRRA